MPSGIEIFMTIFIANFIGFWISHILYDPETDDFKPVYWNHFKAISLSVAIVYKNCLLSFNYIRKNYFMAISWFISCLFANLNKLLC